MSFWKSPSSKIKIFKRSFWHFLNYFKFKTVAKELNKNKTEQKSKTEQKLTWTYLALTEAHLDGPTLPAQPISTPPLSSSSPSPRSCSVASADAAPGHLLLAASPWPLRVTPRSPLAPLSHSLPTPAPFSALPLSRPSALVAAVHCHHGHRASLASPTSPEAPPRPPLPLHRATRSRTRCNAANIAVPVAGHRSSPPSIRDVWRVSEPTEPPCCLPVSLSSFPLTSLSHARPVAAAPRAPEAAVRHGR